MRNAVLDKTVKDNDESLRPINLKDYVGQEQMKKNLEIFIQSAKIRSKTMDHMLFYGPPGLGKTTIAGIIANEMGTHMTSITGPSIEKSGDLVATISALHEGDILFIDEIHRIPKYIEEILYPAMEDFRIDIVIGSGSDGVSGKTIKFNLPKFTLIGATTKVGMLSSPLRDRFGSINRLELYTPNELAQIVKRDAEILNVEITDDALLKIGERSRGTPRIAIRILKRLLDFAVVENPTKPIVNGDITDYGLNALGVGLDGLDANDLRMMTAIHTNFNDGPVGIETLSSFISEDEKTIEEVYEPYLMQIGYIAKTPRGRILTDKGISYVTQYLSNNLHN